MTICPIARLKGCKQCTIVKVCPLKTVLGDYDPGSSTAVASEDEKERSEKKEAS